MNKFFAKVDRVIKLAKAARTEMVQLSSGDLEFEEQVDNRKTFNITIFICKMMAMILMI